MNKIILAGLMVVSLAACSSAIYETTRGYACQVQDGSLDCDKSISTNYPNGTMLLVYELKNGKVICNENNDVPTCTDKAQNPINGILVLKHNNSDNVMSKTWFKNGMAVLDRHYREDGFMWLERNYKESTHYSEPGILKQTVRVKNGKRVITNYAPNGKDIESVEIQDL